jgi:hypothetical protein
VKRFAFAVLVLAVAVQPLVARGGGTRAAGAPQAQWQVLPMKHNPGEWFRELGWASGRVWFGVQVNLPYTGANCSGCMTPAGQIWSAKVSGGKLTSFVSSRVTEDQLGQSLLVGSSLEVANTIAALQPSGAVGPWQPVPGDPAQLANQQVKGSGAGVGELWGAATVGSQTVWAVAGAGMFAACCTDAGIASNLNSTIGSLANWRAFSTHIGADAQGRLWIAWSETIHPLSPILTLHLVQLDSATLKPVSATTVGPAYNGGGGGSRPGNDFTLICTDRCRLVFTRTDGVYIWGGDGPATRLLPSQRGHAGIIAADSVGGSLEVASQSGSPDYAWHVSLNKGKERGGAVRPVAVTGVPEVPVQPSGVLAASEFRAVLTPVGTVVFAAYPLDGRNELPIRATVLH